VQGTRPLGTIILVKLDFFVSFGGRKPTPLNRSRWNLAGRSGPLPVRQHVEFKSRLPAVPVTVWTGTAVPRCRHQTHLRQWSPSAPFSTTLWPWPLIF